MDYLIEMSVIILPAFFIFAIIIYYISESQKNNENIKSSKKRTKKPKESLGNIWGALIILAVIFLIFKGVTSSYKGINSYFKDKSRNETICAERIEDIKNEFTAKKIYEACMKN